MARLLSAITLTWAVLQVVHAIPTTNKLANFETCATVGSINPAFDHFNAIIFGQFSVSNQYIMAGPLAARGTFYSPTDVIINKEQPIDCTVPTSLDALALVVGAEMFASYATVYGSTFLSGTSDSKKINQLSPGCTVRQQKDVTDFHFPKLEQDANDLSAQLAVKEPTLRLDSDSTFKRVAPALNSVEIITFNSCFFKNDCANFFPGKMSDSSRILEGSGTWAGVQGAIQPEAGVTYIMNIPVMEGNTFYLNTLNPTFGFNGCKLFMHYYPVRSNVGLSPEARFYLNRRTSTTVQAFTFAPRADIREDNNKGKFGGAVVAISYVSVYTAQNMARFKNIATVDNTCDRFTGCLPLSGFYPGGNSTVTAVETASKTTAAVVATTSVVNTLPTTITATAVSTVIKAEPTTITALTTTTVTNCQAATVSVTEFVPTTITATATTTVKEVQAFTTTVTKVEPITITITNAVDHLSTITQTAYQTVNRELTTTETLTTQTEYQFFYTNCDVDAQDNQPI